MTILNGERVLLRPITPADRPRVREILSAPEVARWWGDPDHQADGLYEVEEGVSVYLIELDGPVIGLIQSVEELEPQYRHAGIDIALHPDWHGRGLGADAIHTLARHLLRDHHRLTIDPAAHNAAAIRCYTRLGFRPVGLLRQYERGPDGTFHDGLLMDLLAGELTR